jgi:hypothetical protein
LPPFYQYTPVRKHHHCESEPEEQAGHAAVRGEEPSQHEAYPPSSSLRVLLETTGLVLGLRLPTQRCVDSRAMLHATTLGDLRPTAGASLRAEVAPHCTRMMAAVHGIYGDGQFLLPRKRW